MLVRFYLVRSQLKAQTDKRKWQHLGYVLENDHDFWRDEKGRLVLVSCQGECYHVSGHREWDLRDISDEWERQFASGLAEGGEWTTICPHCRENQVFKLVEPKKAFEGPIENHKCSRCGREVRIVWRDIGLVWPSFSRNRVPQRCRSV